MEQAEAAGIATGLNTDAPKKHAKKSKKDAASTKVSSEAADLTPTAVSTEQVPQSVSASPDTPSNETAQAVPVRTKTKAAPTRLVKGEHFELEDTSVWVVVRSTEASAVCKCVRGVGAHKKEIKIGDKAATVTDYTGHKPGETTTLSSSRVGVKFVEAPNKEETLQAQEPSDTEGQQEGDDMSTKKTTKAGGFEPSKSQLEKIKKLRKEGKSYRSICEDLGIKTEHPWNMLHKFA